MGPVGFQLVLVTHGLILGHAKVKGCAVGPWNRPQQFGVVLGFKPTKGVLCFCEGAKVAKD